jgi:hypothetical protein
MNVGGPSRSGIHGHATNRILRQSGFVTSLLVFNIAIGVCLELLLAVSAAEEECSTAVTPLRGG